MQDRTVFDRMHDLIDAIDILYVVAILLAAIGWGVFIVAGWLLAAWRSGAWWNFALLGATSAFLLGGVARELARKQPGAFSSVTFLACVALGIGRALG